MNADKWAFFCKDLTKHERTYLVSLANTGSELNGFLDELRARPRTPVQVNHVGALYEMAGKYADGYNGGGWMALRGLLVEYHKKMVELGL